MWTDGRAIGFLRGGEGVNVAPAPLHAIAERALKSKHQHFPVPSSLQKRPWLTQRANSCDPISSSASRAQVSVGLSVLKAISDSIVAIGVACKGAKTVTKTGATIIRRMTTKNLSNKVAPGIKVVANE